ncbi:S-adenosylhomocysteine nucleosidase [Hylemonella gracilis str. Niagara R]|uniref:adenosylhomocysteine nucleosidase n=1 Tax=Hylemonella gracilis str. Niagara R TaxID=1458275 RepID=A0A016XEI3_9BURK|nr:5'-methylthioadenosine/adenosylhomocysteine nucleosidase [Hylemonella gracilis]EYC50330.1 S-adenosylhomocysteine nucleosidase [Hylemonella gracilis str. Niagara R]
MKLAIVSAMREELAAVLANIEDGVSEQVAGREFWRGRLHGHEVVAVQARIGKVAAAATAAVLAERYQVDAILFTGVAGGLAEGVRRGDVVVAQEFLQHDMDASPLFPRFEAPLYGRARFPTDPSWSERLARAVQRALPQAGLHRGLVVSGDRFVASAADSASLRAALPDALAVEMEGAAVAQVCLDYGLPYAAVRTISDRADDAAHGDFQQFIDETASRYSAAIVQALLV